MSNVGRMDGGFFVSRGELLQWLNGVFRLNLTKVEQCSNGAVYCQVIDSCHPGSVLMKKVNWAARQDHESIPNFKVLQQAFDRVGLQRHIEVDKLVRGKYQDNLEMLQWIKTYYDRTYTGVEYDPLSRRFTDNPPDWARPGDAAIGSYSRPMTSESAAAPSAAARQSQGRSSVSRASPDGRDSGLGRHGAPVAADPSRRGGGSGGGYNAGHGSGGAVVAASSSHSGNAVETDVSRDEHERLREESVDLKITLDGLETERDFYFQKLRDIEILCQALEANPNPHMTVGKFVEDVQRILYAKDDEDDGREEGGN